jgi:hypothetical protein
MDAVALLERLWTEGAGVDDRAALEAARAGDLEIRVADGLSMFADWLAADDGRATGVDGSITERMTNDPAGELLILAIELRAAMHRRDHAAIDLALMAIDQRLAGAPSDTRWATARAGAEIALADAALYNQDLQAARQCLDPVTASGPTAFRIGALLRHVTLALGRHEADVALARARQAMTLAREAQRPKQAEQAQLLLGLVAYQANDTEAMRGALQPLADAGSGSSAAPLITAALAGPDEALALLRKGVPDSAGRGDIAGYALCALAGARSHVAAGRRPDALIAMSSVRAGLGDHAPQVAAVLDAELLAWRHAWGTDAFAEAERTAISQLR